MEESIENPCGDERRRNFPNVITYTAAIRACGDCQEWRKALKLFHEMKLQGLKPNEITYHSIVLALSEAGQEDQAIELIEQAKADGYRIKLKEHNRSPFLM